MGAPPQISLADRHAALAKAAAARRKRAEVKELIKNGSLSVVEIFASEEPAIRKMRVQQLLVALPGVGTIRAQSIMERCNISQSRRVQGLGVKQRRDLLALLGIAE